MLMNNILLKINNSENLNAQQNNFETEIEKDDGEERNQRKKERKNLKRSLKKITKKQFTGKKRVGANFVRIFSPIVS